MLGPSSDRAAPGTSVGSPGLCDWSSFGPGIGFDVVQKLTLHDERCEVPTRSDAVIRVRVSVGAIGQRFEKLPLAELPHVIDGRAVLDIDVAGKNLVGFLECRFVFFGGENLRHNVLVLLGWR